MIPPTSEGSGLRCAIYTRKSTEEGLDQDFNSLDHQRDACEAYVKSQGWRCLSERYDDGGFSGGNTERPALQRLLSDVQAGKIDVVLFYKIDRLSRSLLDFARLMEIFEKHEITIVSVTQLINTATSMGRLMLHVLLSFAQFERELISERTKDKIAAARRKGKWSGGRALLGYDVVDTRLVVNEPEARQVRAIFALYLELQSLLAVVAELQRRGWVTKRLVSRRGGVQGDRPFTKTSLHRLLTNVTYNGRVRYKQETHPGEQPVVIDDTTWTQVQALLMRNGRTGGALVRNKFGALLKGLLQCEHCASAMTPTHSTKGPRRYRYYACSGAQRSGTKCPNRSVPAGAIEQFVVEQLRVIGRDTGLLDAVVEQAQAQAKVGVAELEAERKLVRRNVRKWHSQARALATEAEPGSVVAADPAELHERLRGGETRVVDLDARIAALRASLLSHRDVAQALQEFDAVWAALTPQEQRRVVQELIHQVRYDGANGRVVIAFRNSVLSRGSA